MPHIHTIIDVSTNPPTVSTVNYTAQEDSAADAADAVATSETTRLGTITADATVKQAITLLATSNTSQIDTWLSNNVTTLAQARTVLGHVLKMLAIIIKRSGVDLS